MTKRVLSHLTLSSPSPVLITESADEFARFHEALKQELKPEGAVEHLLLDDVAMSAWQIRRYRRAKTALHLRSTVRSHA